MLLRKNLEATVRQALRRSRGVVLAGRRQSGKSTIAQAILSRDSTSHFDLEYPPHVQRLIEPTQTLQHLAGLVVIDEVQLRPGLFPLLRVLMDRSDKPRQYLLLGSASPHLLRQAGESLLGRVETVEVGEFDLQEVARQDAQYDDDASPAFGCEVGFRGPFLP
jgi:uncharacterized protein